jgi:hypothetical protein
MKRTQRPETSGRLSSTRRLLSASWAADVDAIETAMSRFEDGHPLAGDCQVAFFEIAADERLHVNVTHRHPTKEIRGWAGPASTPDGFVTNRTFSAVPTARIVRHLRDMIFAAQARGRR